MTDIKDIIAGCRIIQGLSPTSGLFEMAQMDIKNGLRIKISKWDLDWIDLVSISLNIDKIFLRYGSAVIAYITV